MPRNVKGIGRTGTKHKKPAKGGGPVIPNQEGITGPLFTSLQDTTNEPDGQAAEANRDRHRRQRSNSDLTPTLSHPLERSNTSAQPFQQSDALILGSAF